MVTDTADLRSSGPQGRSRRQTGAELSFPKRGESSFEPFVMAVMVIVTIVIVTVMAVMAVMAVMVNGC